MGDEDKYQSDSFWSCLIDSWFWIWKKKSDNDKRPSSLIDSSSISGIKERDGQISLNGTKNLENYYDMVIIGSGCGSSVIAARMAEE